MGLPVPRRSLVATSHLVRARLPAQTSTAQPGQQPTSSSCFPVLAAHPVPRLARTSQWLALPRPHLPARIAETHDLLARLHPVQLPHALTLVYVPPPHSGESQRSTYVKERR